MASERGEPQPGLSGLPARVRQLIGAIRDSDEVAVEDAVARLSRSRRVLAPLALAVGAVAMLFEGLKLVVTNWRLTLIQLLPAMWIWVAMFDLKAHVLYGKTYHVVRGPVRIPIVLAIAAITAASFFLNAWFAFAIAQTHALIRPALHETRAHLGTILAWGSTVGLCLGLSTVVFVRWGLGWFALSLSIVIAVMMVSYVAVPSRLIGMTSTYSRRDRLTATATSSAIGAVVCTPPYLLGRVGLLMLGSRTLLIPGIIVFASGLALQTGATTAIKAIKMTAMLVSGHRQTAGNHTPSGDPAQPARDPAGQTRRNAHTAGHQDPEHLRNDPG